MVYPHLLAWIDLETDGLPPEDDRNNYADVHILEAGLIVTDFALNKVVGYSETVRLTKPAADRIRANDYVKNMHKTSGLLADAINAQHTVSQVENEMVAVLAEVGQPGDFMIAGSGVASFDFPLIKTHMPRVAAYFAYFPFDIGIIRRGTRILAGHDIVGPSPASYGDMKEHRAFGDVQAHLAEAVLYQTLLRSLPEGH